MSIRGKVRSVICPEETPESRYGCLQMKTLRDEVRDVLRIRYVSQTLTRDRFIYLIDRIDD